jgi:Zn-dependent protease with chaperone function
MILALALTGLAMLLGAGLSPGLGEQAHPPHRTRITIAVLLTGFFLVETALQLWFAPVFFDMVGLTDLAAECRRMLGGMVPGGVAGGIAAGLSAVLLLAVALRGWWGVLRDQRTLRVESVLASRESHDAYDLVILPSSKRMAYTVGGRNPQVVLTTAFVEAFPLPSWT